MTGIGVAMLAHNEERFIGEALASVAWADEIVVVDAASTDRTAEIAREHGATVLARPNDPNLNRNKNAAIEALTTDWVLVLDADERIPPELAAEMRQLVATHPEHAGYFLPRRNYVMGHWVRHGGHYPDAQLRLVRAGARFPARHVHERIRVHGTTGRLHHPMDHETYPTLDDLMRKARFYALYEGDVLAEKEARVTAWTVLRKGLGRGLARTLRRYLLKGGFRDGVPGLTVAFFGLFNRLVRWIRLWELRHGRRAKGADSSGGDEPRL